MIFVSHARFLPRAGGGGKGGLRDSCLPMKFGLETITMELCMAVDFAPPPQKKKVLGRKPACADRSDRMSSFYDIVSIFVKKHSRLC